MLFAKLAALVGGIIRSRLESALMVMPRISIVSINLS